MGLFSFLKDKGDKVEVEKSDSAHDEMKARAAKSRALMKRVQAMGFDVEGLKVGYDDGAVMVDGEVSSQEEKEKIVLVLGNTYGVSSVDDRLTVKSSGSGARATFYTVESGDSLSKIAKEHLGSANAYMEIFEANKDQLTDPDKIKPGQVLRIP